MPCYKPIKGYMHFNEGKRKFVPNQDAFKGQTSYMEVSCGQCIGCRLDHSRDWAVRLVHEAHNWEDEKRLFLTLTYAPENLPEDGSLQKEHFTTFMKTLRDHFADKVTYTNLNTKRTYTKRIYKKIRYFQCGEYGEVCQNCGESKFYHIERTKHYHGCNAWTPTFGRPHHHAIIFGISFDDMELYKRTPQGELLYISRTLDKLWEHGYCTIGEVTFESCAYVARYVTKKINGPTKEEHYKKRIVNKVTGEVEEHPIQPEYATMSRRPGIGKDFYDKYQQDIHGGDQVIITRGTKTIQSKPPRYYDKLLHKQCHLEDGTPIKEDYKNIKTKRIDNAVKSIDNKPVRLKAREAVKRAQTKNLNRTFEEHHL